jgi:hypothetical protein
LVKYRCYNLYLGDAFDGSRRNKLYAEDLDHASILATLDRLFAAYARERQQGERFALAISAYARGRSGPDEQRPRFPCPRGRRQARLRSYYHMYKLSTA